jgi:hypothetical protein
VTLFTVMGATSINVLSAPLIGLLLFELCRRTQQPSLTFRPVGGSTFGLWPMFHSIDGGKMDRNDCHTAWVNFKTLISSLHHYTNYACSFSSNGFYIYIFVVFYLSYLVSPSTSCKSQLFNASVSGNINTCMGLYSSLDSNVKQKTKADRIYFRRPLSNG